VADYNGPCRAVAPMTDEFVTSSPCVNVTCPTRHTLGCRRPLLPPGACCPICAGEIRTLVSTVSRTTPSHSGPAPAAGTGTSQSQQPPLTVQDLVDELRMLMRVYECEAFGYVSVERELVFLIAPIGTHAPVSSLQVRACSMETRRLAALLSTTAPSVSASPGLSSCRAVDVRTPDVNSGSDDELPSGRTSASSSSSSLHLSGNSSTSVFGAFFGLRMLILLLPLVRGWFVGVVTSRSGDLHTDYHCYMIAQEDAVVR
jgi:hypothetical protein